MHIAFGIFSIGDGQPDPLHACISGQIAVALGSFALFEQSDNVCTSHLVNGWEIFISWTMEKSHPSIPDFYKPDR